MKRNLLLTIIGILGICLFSSFTKDKTPKQPKVTGVYTFGFSASFTDSTVYFTSIQHFDDIALESKTKFLPHCPEYSNQLQEYLETKKGETRRVCATYSAATKKQIDKIYGQLQKLYANQSTMKIIYLSENDFKYTKVEDEEEEE